MAQSEISTTETQRAQGSHGGGFRFHCPIARPVGLPLPLLSQVGVSQISLLLRNADHLPCSLGIEESSRLSDVVSEKLPRLAPCTSTSSCPGAPGWFLFIPAVEPLNSQKNLTLRFVHPSRFLQTSWFTFPAAPKLAEWPIHPPGVQPQPVFSVTVPAIKAVGSRRQLN